MNGVDRMIPADSHPMWRKLIGAEINHKFSVASAGLLFFNLQMKYKKDPSVLSPCIKEARAFFEKYESVLTTDIVTLFP